MSGPEKTLYLHIGFHKTGTSALQEALHGSQEQLESAGVLYPKPLCTYQSHLDLAQPLFGTDMPWVSEAFDFDETYNHYRDVIESALPGSIVILSTEELCRADRNHEVIERIHSKFGAIKDTQTKIVAYRRDPVGFLLSLYHHEVRAGVYTDHFEEFINSHINLNVVRFGRRLKGWRDVFGASNVVVRDYDHALKRYGRNGIVRDFLDLIGKLDLVLPEPERRVNVGVHPWLVEAYLQINKVDLPEEDRQRLKRRTLRLGEEFPAVNASVYYLGEDGTRALRKAIDQPA